jgi:hypothetical protein
MKQPDFYHAEISELVLRWDKWINVPGDGVEQYGYCIGANGQHLALLMADHLLIQSTVLIQYASYTTIIIIIIITITITITIIIIIIISFMQGIYTYIPETNYVPREYSVAAILLCLYS